MRDENTPLKEPLSKLKDQLNAAKTKDQQTKAETMIYLDTIPAPAGLTVETIGDYTNIFDTILNKNKTRMFNLVFGKVANIQRAIDFALYPKMLPSYLGKPKLNALIVKKLGSQRHSIPNFWAYIGYVLIERIRQSQELINILLEDKPIINMEVLEVNSFKGPLKTLQPIPADNMYVGVIRVVVDALRSSQGLSDDERVVVFNKVIYDLKRVKDKSIFDGIDFETEFV